MTRDPGAPSTFEMVSSAVTEELAFRLFPYMERAGVVSALLMAVALVVAIRVIITMRKDHADDVAGLKKDLREERERNSALQDKWIEAALDAVAVVERNTARGDVLAELVRNVLTMKAPRP